MLLLQEWCHMIVFGLSKTSFAALFWTHCKREIWFNGNPARMKLQWSSDIMANETSWVVAL